MTTNNCQQPKLKKTKTKTNKANNQNRNRITEMEITWRVINRGVGRGERGKGTENKQHKQQVENRQGEGKNSIGNVEAKDLICMTHGHELWGVIEGCRVEWSEGGEMGQL